MKAINYIIEFFFIKQICFLVVNSSKKFSFYCNFCFQITENIRKINQNNFETFAAVEVNFFFDLFTTVVYIFMTDLKSLDQHFCICCCVKDLVLITMVSQIFCFMQYLFRVNVFFV